MVKCRMGKAIIKIDYFKLLQWIRHARYSLDKIEGELNRAVEEQGAKIPDRRVVEDRRNGKN